MQQKSTDSNHLTNKDGFLRDKNAWNVSIAQKIASAENLTLTDDHWTVIHLLRDFYHQYEMEPALRLLIKKLSDHWQKDKANSLYLYKLFPKGPIMQASKIAGLPKPKKCL